MLKRKRSVRVQTVRQRAPSIAVIAVAAIAAAGCSASAHEAAQPRTLPRPAYQRALRTLASDGYSGAVAVVETVDGTWRGAAGWADFEARRRAEPGDRFAIESTTKTFVAAVVLQLVQDKRLSLEDRVQRWLPGLLPARPTITVRELLNHPSGLRPDLYLRQA